MNSSRLHLRPPFLKLPLKHYRGSVSEAPEVLSARAAVHSQLEDVGPQEFVASALVGVGVGMALDGVHPRPARDHALGPRAVDTSF